MSPEIEFYFDFLSPYGFLAWVKGKALCQQHGWELYAKPVVFGALLDKWGHKGPAEIPAKRAFVIRDAMRKAAGLGIELTFPEFHPFNPIPALRVSLLEVAGKNQPDVIDAIWDTGWVKGEDLGSPDVLKTALDKKGIDGAYLLARTSEPAIKERLKQNTDEAIQLGMFGVPTFVVKNELFWGEDQIPALEAFILGKDPLNRARYDEILVRPRGIDRKKI